MNHKKREMKYFTRAPGIGANNHRPSSLEASESAMNLPNILERPSEIEL
jgi:hypothetical protein